MDINDEQQYYIGLTKSVHETIDMMYENIFACEESMEGLLKIAPTVFSYSEFLMLLNDYKLLDERASRFERAVMDIREQIGVNDIDSVIRLDGACSALGAVFMLLNDYMDKANTRIEAKQFDMDKVMLLERIENKIGLEYDTVDYMSLSEAFKGMFIVLQVKNRHDNIGEEYGDMNVLVINSFKTKIEANRFALANGISRDMTMRRI